MHFLRLVGCGTGVPISQVLIERGFKVYGVDAPPAIVVVAWGFFFLLDAEVQRGLIKKLAVCCKAVAVPLAACQPGRRSEPTHS